MTDSNHNFSQFCSWPMKPRKRNGNIYTALNIVFDSLDEIVKYEMKVTEQYFPVVLFIMLNKVFLTFKSVDKILKCDH